ncbi:N-acetyltransferase [Methanolobus sp. ZRKC2]|uniref:GNAT family N-acetyltransferase n=1 Tax=Methanolobus sp. ZRKC2 TaxID=3125783 RepID=UPI00324BCCB5
MDKLPNVTIRLFRENDYGAVASILVDSFMDKFYSLANLPKETMIEFFKDSGIVGNRTFEGYWVAEANDEILGVMLLKWKKQNRVKSHSNLSFVQLCQKYGFFKVIKLFLGLFVLSYEEISDDECYIEHIAVSSESRGLGIGTKLINFGSRFVESTPGLNKYSLSVASSNKRAIDLYESLGFVLEKSKNSMISKLLVNEGSWLYMVKH